MSRHLISQYNGLVVIYDTLCEHTEGVICETPAELSRAWLSCIGKSAKIVYQPVDPLNEFSLICDLVYSSGDLLFVIEEIDTFLSINSKGNDFNFLNIIQRGRHRNIDVIGITQRPYSIPAILRSQAKIIYSFRQFENRDIEWLRQVFSEQAERARDLKQFHYLKYENGEITENYTDIRTKESAGKAVPVVPVQPEQGKELLSKGDTEIV